MLKRPEIDWEKMIEKEESSQSYKKIKNYFILIIKEPEFKAEIKKIRKKFKIPEKGFKIPSNGVMPNVDNMMNFGNSLQKILNDYSLHKSYWYETLEYYVYYNEFTEWSGLRKGLVSANDLRADIEEYNLYLSDEFDQEKVEEVYSKSYVGEDDKYFPIALRISPWASKRDILDYVNKNYSTFIKKIQDRYKEGKNISIKRKKNTRVNERNEFIYENRELPSKELMSLVNKKYGDLLDYTYINQIISKKRKEKK